jgi:hypothetical protein
MVRSHAVGARARELAQRRDRHRDREGLFSLLILYFLAREKEATLRDGST